MKTKNLLKYIIIGIVCAGLFLFALIVLFPHGAGNGYAEYDGKDIIKNALEAVRPGLILSGFSS